jgi:hypothetical protein
MKRDFFYLNANKERKGKYRQAKNQEKNSSLKCRSQRIRLKNHTKEIEQTMTLTLV